MYLKIFEDVISILHNDYAGCLDKKGCDNPNFYREKIQDSGNMNDEKFVGIVQDYLLDFKDLHMAFKYTAQSTEMEDDVGFAVRRYDDLLYVVSNEKEDRVKKGYAITALDGSTVPELVNIHKRRLMETEAERENWSAILPQYKSADVVSGSGNSFTIELKKYPKEIFQPEYSIKEISEDTLFLTLTDFMNHNAISKLIDENRSFLTTRKNLIIDVRVNRGGSDLAYFDLLPFLFEGEGEEIDLNGFDEGSMLTNCTSRNVELRTQLLKSALSSIEDEVTRNQINAFIRQLEENKDNGFVELDFGEVDDSFLIKTKPGPEQVILLTDVYCGSSGDSFVELCKNSSKVTVIGRPTLGLNDYSNLAIMSWENKFKLSYPTSKLSTVDEGKGMSGVGIQPDIYIPWTPDHIDVDLDVKKALEFI
ncbi:S41 family peptidase [Virgibacillus salinus]|uniref:Peptidase family S41 n=1 Tax=Virgibacillus salinus TaxID=553311 RepID=A0A1H1E2U0_9BACI|nr:S41 family peptidase [Virgibacillus salinus]SDQ83075.1 Peptidase family S41 [Virgibacillus salinus]